MNLIKKLARTAIVAKAVQVAHRELSKPENQAKIRAGLSKLSNAARRS